MFGSGPRFTWLVCVDGCVAVGAIGVVAGFVLVVGDVDVDGAKSVCALATGAVNASTVG
jgi:hypothetical protein